MIWLVAVIALMIFITFWAALIWASCFSSSGVVRAIGLVAVTLAGLVSLVAVVAHVAQGELARGILDALPSLPVAVAAWVVFLRRKMLSEDRATPGTVPKA